MIHNVHTAATHTWFMNEATGAVIVAMGMSTPDTVIDATTLTVRLDRLQDGTMLWQPVGGRLADRVRVSSTPPGWAGDDDPELHPAVGGFDLPPMPTVHGQLRQCLAQIERAVATTIHDVGTRFTVPGEAPPYVVHASVLPWLLQAVKSSGLGAVDADGALDAIAAVIRNIDRAGAAARVLVQLPAISGASTTPTIQHGEHR